MRIKLCLCFTILSILLSGCWNKKELSDLVIVEGVGIDRTSDGIYKLSFQLLKPSEAKRSTGTKEQGQTGKGTWVLSSTGETMFEAIRNATLQSARKLYFPHNRVLIISEEVAREGIKPLMDFFTRDPETRRLIYIFISNGNAEDIINAVHPQENIPAVAIEELAKTSYASSKVVEINLNDILINLSSKTNNPIAPGIQIMKDKELQQGENRIKLKNTAIFKDDKFIDWYDEDETRGLLWITGKVKSGILVTSLRDDKASLEIIHATSKLEPTIVDNNIFMEIKIKAESNIGEVLGNVNLDAPEIVKELEKKQCEVIKNHVQKAIYKSKNELKVDNLGFGEAVHRTNPSNWDEIEKDWEKIFPQIQVNVDVESIIRRKGMGGSGEEK